MSLWHSLDNLRPTAFSVDAPWQQINRYFLSGCSTRLWGVWLSPCSTSVSPCVGRWAGQHISSWLHLGGRASYPKALKGTSTNLWKSMQNIFIFFLGLGGRQRSHPSHGARREQEPLQWTQVTPCNRSDALTQGEKDEAREMCKEGEVHSRGLDCLMPVDCFCLGRAWWFLCKWRPRHFRTGWVEESEWNKRWRISPSLTALKKTEMKKFPKVIFQRLPVNRI